jgi:phosphonate transport system ATP-binding protein
MQEPDVLLADEPVASLDPALCHTVMDYLRKINRDLGITVLCNLHHLDLVKDYSDRAIALKDGKKVFEGDPSEINDEWFRQIYGEEARRVN